MQKLITALLLVLCSSLANAASPKPNIEALAFGWLFWQVEVLEGREGRNAGDDYWHSISLPDSGRAAQRSNNNIWYRLKIPNNLPNEFRSGVFIDRSLMNLEVYLNNDYLGSGGSINSPVDRNWNQPHLFTIPTSSWQADNNILYMHLVGSNGFSTVAPPALVNYQQTKTSFYQPKQLIRIELSRFSFAVMLCISVFCWLIWYQTRQLLLLILAMASLSWMVVLAYIYFRQFSLEHAVFVRLVHWCIDACSLMLLLFARKKYGYPVRKLTRIIAGYLISLGLVLMFTPDRSVVILANSLHVVSQLVILYLVVFTAYKYWRNRSVSDLSFCLGLLIIVTFLIHDMSLSLSSDWNRWMYDAHLGHLSVPVLFILLCFSLSNMYKHHLLASEQLNANLEQRLTQAKVNLKQQLQDMEALATAQRVSEEREHIYQDVHDDLGAKLLSLVYASPEPRKNDLARSALQDLRDVVSRANTHEVSLNALLSETLSEQQQRCDKLGVSLESNIQGDCNNTTYSANKAVLFKRLLRELVGLYIHSAHVSALRIDVMVGVSGVETAVIGNAEANHIDTLSLKARAARINSKLHVLHEHDQQLQVVFWIPNNAITTSPIEGV